MDLSTSTIALLGLIKKKWLPTVTTSESGEVLVVGQDGKWTPGEPTSAVISASQIESDDYAITVS